MEYVYRQIDLSDLELILQASAINKVVTTQEDVV